MKIDMAWGSPAFLTDYWKKYPIKVDHIKKSHDYKLGSSDSLKKKIHLLHKKCNNANTKNKYIVVAAGATQILIALLSVLKDRFKARSAWANPPHFSRFPILANLAKLNWKNTPKAIQIFSSPNNPDGIELLPYKQDSSKIIILDLCYNWSQYTTTDPYFFDAPIMVFSLSKATGHASTRIGWAILEDKNLAAEVEQYIEVSTGGLSIDAQVKAEQIISHQLSLKWEDTVFNYGKKELNRRWNTINKLNPEFKILNNSGMFLWAEGTCPKEIIYLNGTHLRGREKQFRLNLGCSKKTFKSFVNAIKQKE